jgi:hypothetical protein
MQMRRFLSDNDGGGASGDKDAHSVSLDSTHVEPAEAKPKDDEKGRKINRQDDQERGKKSFSKRSMA